MTIYEIDHAMLDCLDLDTGEIIDVEALDALEIERNAKIDNLACYYKNLMAEATALSNEMEELKKRQKIKENKAESVKKYLANVLQGQKFETTRNKISWSRSTAVNPLDIDQVSEKYKVIKISTEVDKMAVKEAVKAGETVAGVEIIYNLNIHIK